MSENKRNLTGMDIEIIKQIVYNINNSILKIVGNNQSGL